MVWLRMIWWVLWRSLLYGGVEGIVFGTLVSPRDGTIYGVLIGTIIGTLLGLLNGISLAIMTRLAFHPPIDRSRYLRWAMIIVIPVDLIIALVCSTLIGVLGLVAALITATIAYYLRFGFTDYTITQLASDRRLDLAYRPIYRVLENEHVHIEAKGNIMKWLNLIAWVLWRGAVCGVIQGLLFGTGIALIYGTIYGAIIGGLLGVVLGLVNGISLAVITRFYFNPPHHSDRYLTVIRLAAIPLDMLVVFAVSSSVVGLLAIIPALIAAADVYYFSSGFREYAKTLMQPTRPLILTDDMSDFTWLPKQQPKPRKAVIIWVLTALLVIAAAVRLIGYPPQKTRIPDRYLIPAGYTGWVKISYGVPDAPPLPIEDGYHLLVIAANGELKTASTYEYGMVTTEEYYAYKADGSRSPLPATTWSGGGMIWADSLGGDGSGNFYATFFVGTETQYNQLLTDTPTRQPPTNVLLPR